MHVENIASQSSVVFETHYTAWLKKTISGVYVHVSPGSATTLVRGGGITNYRLIAYSLSNSCAKNYQNRSMCVEVMVSTSLSIFKTRCTYWAVHSVVEWTNWMSCSNCCWLDMRDTTMAFRLHRKKAVSLQNSTAHLFCFVMLFCVSLYKVGMCWYYQYYILNFESQELS